MDGRRSWKDMELDCLAEVFKKLGLDDLTLTIPLVCKSWNAAVRHPLCWKKLDFRQLDLLPWSSFSKSFALYYYLPHFSFTFFLKFALRQSCKSVTELSFPLKSTSLEDVVLATEECPKLKSVALPRLSSGEEVQISDLVCKCRDVEQLKMESKPSNFPDLARNIGLHCRNFRELVVSGQITEVDALAIVGYLPMLKELDLSNSNLPKTELLTIIKGCKQLKKLNVNGCIGFQGDDKQILETASCIKDFKNEACKLYYEDTYQSGEWDSDFCLQGYVV